MKDRQNFIRAVRDANTMFKLGRRQRMKIKINDDGAVWIGTAKEFLGYEEPSETSAQEIIEWA